jgi:hypothetical protein
MVIKMQSLRGKDHHLGFAHQLQYFWLGQEGSYTFAMYGKESDGSIR